MFYIFRVYKISPWNMIFLDLFLIIFFFNDFWQKRKIDHFDPCNLLLAIATNIPVQLVTGFVTQGHIWSL